MRTQIYLKLTGDKISLFDIRRGAREAKPSVEIDLETLLQVDEDVSAQELPSCGRCGKR